MEQESALALLSEGKAPNNADILMKLTSGSSFVLDFWNNHYLSSFIKDGGSKIKFLTGRPGAGKTHTLMLLSEKAKGDGYLTANLSAAETPLYTFLEWYKAILASLDIQSIIKKCSQKIIASMGFSPTEIPSDETFRDYLCNNGAGDALTLRQLRNELRQAFLDNPHMDNNFALAISMLTGSVLDYPQLDEQSKALVYLWLNGDTSMKLTQIKALGFSPYRITKYNARHMLRSLIEVIVFAGYTGLVVTVDNLESLLGNSSMDAVHYTKMRRDDTFESIRELIDAIDSFHHVLFVFASRKELFDDENHGIKTYQALWMRIQNEVISKRINGFADIMDLDAVERQTFTADTLVEMSQKLVSVLHGLNTDALVIDRETAATILAKAGNGDVSIPRLVNQATFGKLQRQIEEADHV